MPKIETDTNQVYRKKYFVAADDILSTKNMVKQKRPQNYGAVIDASRIKVTNEPKVLGRKTHKENDDIRVEVIRSGNQIKSLRIMCPCGRHTELNVQYEQNSNVQKT